MAKKKTAKKRPAKKAAKKKRARTAAKASSRKSTTATKKTSRKAAPKSKKKAAARKSSRSKTTSRKTPRRADAGTKRADRKPAAKANASREKDKEQTPVVESAPSTSPDASASVGSSSVIRIKSNTKPKRRPNASSTPLNHKGEASGATSQDPIQFPEESRKLPKTHLTAKELREFKALLYAKRAELCGDVERLTAEAFYQDQDSGGDRSNMPIHMADLGSDNWEQDFTLGLIDNERHLVAEIDAALARIDEKTYGICLATHNKISHARLRAKPWAKYCIEYARAREDGRA